MGIHSIELCAGIGMLGEGVRAAFKHLGYEHRTVCYVEREASAAGQLAALMEEGALDAAPIWSDLVTFDGAAWRGLVDCVIAGFPCQDLSVAGKRAGLDGKRSGLFFHVADIADACGARFLILENVAGIASATATVVDETEGELDERAASRVLGELADRGWHAEWMHLRASDVGANHQRERWFCLAWRDVVDSIRNVGDRSRDRESRCGRRICQAGAPMADAYDDGSQGRGVSAATGRIESGNSQWTSAAMGNARCERAGADQPERFAECGDTADVGTRRGAMVDTECSERRALGLCGGGCKPRQDGKREASGRNGIGGSALGDTDEQREQQPHDEDGAKSRQRAWGRVGGTGRGHDDIFAPGPLNTRWPGIVADRPDLAPAVGGRLNSNFTEWLMGWPIGWCDPKEPVNHAEAENWRAAILRALQNIVGEEAHQREVGGFRCIQSPKILQQELYGGVHVERRSETAGVCDSSSQAIVEEELRTLRIYEPPVDPSQRPKLEEQCAEQFANPMQFVSHIIASLRGRNVSASAREAAMQVLWEAELQVRGLQHMSDENKATWESLLWEERVDCLVEAAITAHQKPSRNHQLRQAGNGVVALQASVAIVTLARRAGIF